MAGGVITWVLITDGVRDISFGLSMNFLPVYMQDYGGLSFRQIGLMNSIFGFFMMISTIPGGWLADKKGERVNIVLGFILIGIGARAAGLLADDQPLALRSRLGNRRDGRGVDDPRIPKPDQQGGPEEGARDCIRVVQLQPGIGQPASAVDWRADVGEVWAALPIYRDNRGLIPGNHSGLVQIQTTKERQW